MQIEIDTSQNPTNGDVIKAMFPRRKVIEHDTYIEVAWGEGMDEFDKNWWNAPYEMVVSE